MACLPAASACLDGAALTFAPPRLADAVDVVDSAAPTEDTPAPTPDDTVGPPDLVTPPAEAILLTNALLVGVDPTDGGERSRSILVVDGRVAALDPPPAVVPPGTPTRDLAGLWLTPAFIDSHVHLRYWDVAAELYAAGLVAAVDLAAPPDFFVRDWSPLEVIGSGPMLAAIAGYPTQSWGRNGYGRECATLADALAAIDELAARGARLVKVSLGAGPDLPDELLAAAIAHARSLGLPVAAHALTDAAAARAATLGADVLAHTPLERLADATVAAWSSRAVITTLTAFSPTPTVIDNLRRLHAAGATVLYGTDLGNSRVPAIDPRELALMAEAGLDPSEILGAATAAPAAFWGFAEYGALVPGGSAVFLVYGSDPLADPTVFAAPLEVLDLR